MILRSAEESTPAKRSFLLGWETSEQPREIGFHAGESRSQPIISRADVEAAFRYQGDSHYLCIAPTGCGKGRSVLIPNLLTTDATCIVLDIKGELYHVTAEARRRLGQQVYCLDPFGLTKRPSDGLNPLDRFRLSTCDVESEAQAMADALSCGHEFSSDPFWSTVGTAFGAGVLAHLATGAAEEDRHLNTLLDYLFADDIVYKFAVLLDSKTVASRMAYRQIAAMLQLPEKTRESVIATTQSYVSALQSASVQRTLARSTFDLADLVAGKPMTIYLCIPPDKLRGYAGLLRLWLGTFLTALAGRDHKVERPTWFFIDEAAQLGPWKQLEQILTLMRGYGVQAATFWQDVSQLRNNFPLSWPTILNNSAVIQTFGLDKWLQAKELGDVFGVGPETLLARGATESTVLLPNGALRVVEKCDYLRDAAFAGKYSGNPRFVRWDEAR